MTTQGPALEPQAQCGHGRQGQGLLSNRTPGPSREGTLFSTQSDGDTTHGFTCLLRRQSLVPHQVGQVVSESGEAPG
jgi:hypothetical protein